MAARPLLLAPLFAPTAAWTSRTIAEITGQSQSAVARAWTRAYTTAATNLGDRIPAAGLRLVAAAVDASNSILVLTLDGSPDHAFAGSFMRSPRRPPLQTLLAADLRAADLVRPVPGPTVRPALPASATTATAGTEDVRLVRAVRRYRGEDVPVYVLTRHPVRAVNAGAAALGHIEVVVEDPAAWQGLLADLVRRCTRSPATELLAAQHLAMQWARGDRARFEWTAYRGEGRPNLPGGTIVPTPPRAASQALADDVLTVLLEGITAGRLAGGDRVTDSFLARAVHASRGHVTDSLRTLAAAGLIDLEPRRGAVIPTPQTADVVETYAARRALGALVVRRAARWGPGALDPVDRALRDLVETGRSGNAHATGEADLRFQDAVARSTGMRRIPGMFYGLTAQLRLFVAVMGLDYTYSIPGMCQDDATLLERIRARDETGAVRVWHRKIDDAVTYMTTQLNVAAVNRRSAGRS